MTYNELQQNIQRIKEIVREVYIFTNQLEIIQKLEIDRNIIINTEEKRLLKNTINSLTVQLRILNNSIPALIDNVGFFERLSPEVQESRSRLAPARQAPNRHGSAVLEGRRKMT